MSVLKFVSWSVLRPNIRMFSSGMESKTVVNGQTINYLKVGNGNHHVLCFPGALGTIWSDFKPQIEGLNRDDFTVIVWDPPGYGHSRPPIRNFCTKFYENDAEMALSFMHAIGSDKFSILGWSDGGISGLILAGNHPEAMRKLIVWGSNSYVLPEELESYEKIRDISQWSERMKAPLIALYGEKGLQDMWNGWCDALQDIYKQNGGDICKNHLGKINCPTFILHGDKDPMVAAEHPTHLLSAIKGAKLHNFPEGKHNIHLKYSREFNELVTKFLTSETSKL